MSALVTGKATKRLADLLGRLGSAHEGERSNAALMADTHIRSLGLDWNALVDRAFRAPASPQQPMRRSAFNPRSQIRWLRSCGPLLSDWERRFVADLDGQGYPLTSRQIDKLRDVCERVEGRCGAAAEARP